jgi:hypothetical protein
MKKATDAEIDKVAQELGRMAWAGYTEEERKAEMSRRRRLGLKRALARKEKGE